MLFNGLGSFSNSGRGANLTVYPFTTSRYRLVLTGTCVLLSAWAADLGSCKIRRMSEKPHEPEPDPPETPEEEARRMLRDTARKGGALLPEDSELPEEK
jgi:hypothetical protein